MQNHRSRRVSTRTPIRRSKVVRHMDRLLDGALQMQFICLHSWEHEMVAKYLREHERVAGRRGVTFTQYARLYEHLSSVIQNMLDTVEYHADRYALFAPVCTQEDFDWFVEWESNTTPDEIIASGRAGVAYLDAMRICLADHVCESYKALVVMDWFYDVYKGRVPEASRPDMSKIAMLSKRILAQVR